MEYLPPLELLKIDKHASRYGGYFYYLFFKDKAAGKSYKTCVADNCRNFSKWAFIIYAKDQDGNFKMIGRLFGNMYTKSEKLINADSMPELVEPAYRSN